MHRLAARLPGPVIAAVVALAAMPALAADSLGVFGQWGAFRDTQGPRCYAIAAAQAGSARRDRTPYVTIGTWPARGVRGQVHFRLSRDLGTAPRIRLAIGGERFELTGGGSDAWAQDAGADAAIRAAMRSAGRMSVSATDRRGNRFTDRYSLEGVATAMDAASVGCARRR